MSTNDRHPLGSASRPETHARHQVEPGPHYSLDSLLHISRYRWVIEHFVREDDKVVDLGCGTGFGTVLLSRKCDQVVGIDFDPCVTGLAETIDATKASFYCEDICSPDLASRLGIRDADVVMSMETIEHLEDYFSFIENAIDMMEPDGTFIVGTPNRRMTYERYPERRHMDPSHVQEFTPISLERTLKGFFESVELYFQYLPNYWSDIAGRTRFRRAVKGWIPPNLVTLGRRILMGRKASSEGSGANQPHGLDDAAFERASDVQGLSLDAFALVAVCKRPHIIG